MFLSAAAYLEEKMAFQGYQNNRNWPENTNFYFEPQQVVNPIQTGKCSLPVTVTVNGHKQERATATAQTKHFSLNTARGVRARVTQALGVEVTLLSRYLSLSGTCPLAFSPANPVLNKGTEIHIH